MYGGKMKFIEEMLKANEKMKEFYECIHYDNPDFYGDWQDDPDANVDNDD